LSSLVDWPLAERVATLAAGDGPASMADEVDLAATARLAETAVLAYTGLVPGEPVAAAEWVSRREWALINLAAMRELISAAEDGLRTTLPGGARNPLALVAGRVLAIEIGGLVGLASRRVLGQYEFALLGERAPRLLFVGPNVDAAAGSLGGEPSETLRWVALHEVTHAVQMASAPWVRSHLGERARVLLDGAAFRISPTELVGRARAAASGDPRTALAELRSSDPLRLIAPDSARATIDEVQATMSLVEGYAEHVMDAAAGDLAPNVARLRRGMDARREGRSAPIRLLLWLLGLEAKLRQYREGKAFADTVAERVGIGGLNEAWNGPEALPDRHELADPEAWISRPTPV
jgi:coenzyme F420 biosynthesis associated uncharacterized protein